MPETVKIEPELLTKDQIAAIPARLQQPPPIITGLCQKCGRCCAYTDCQQQDLQTKLCKIYDSRPIPCRIWPNRKDAIDIVGCPGYRRI